MTGRDPQYKRPRPTETRGFFSYRLEQVVGSARPPLAQSSAGSLEPGPRQGHGKPDSAALALSSEPCPPGAFARCRAPAAGWSATPTCRAAGGG